MMRAAIIDVIERVARRCGVVVAPCWRASQIDEEFHMRRLLRYLDVDCVFDVGANIGQYGTKLRRYFDFSELIISFEPNLALMDALRRVADRDVKWIVLPFALGNKAGDAVFQAYEESTLGSFLSLNGESAHSPKRMDSKKITVRVERLGDILGEYQRKYGFKRPFLKMDTQGFDLEVVKGAGELIREFVGIQTEVSFNPIYTGAPSYQQMMDYYQAQGFSLSRLVPIHSLHFPDLVEMDAILVRN